MTVAIDQVLRAIAADVTIVGAGRARLSDGAIVAFGRADAPVAGLTELLYARHYCRPGQPREEGGTDDAAFLATLQAANAVRSRGDAAREMVTAGHYFALGRATLDAVTGRQVRFYWNVAPGAAAALIAELTAGLDRRRLPFQLKVPVTPRGYDRADAGVLYAAAEDVPCLVDIVQAAWAAVQPGRRPDVPLFARRLAAGLAFAESPPDGESFGLQRCRLLAEGLAAAGPGGDAVAAMTARLTGYGLRLASLERNPGTAYPHNLTGFEE